MASFTTALEMVKDGRTAVEQKILHVKTYPAQHPVGALERLSAFLSYYDAHVKQQIYEGELAGVHAAAHLVKGEALDAAAAEG